MLWYMADSVYQYPADWSELWNAVYRSTKSVIMMELYKI